MERRKVSEINFSFLHAFFCVRQNLLTKKKKLSAIGHPIIQIGKKKRQECKSIQMKHQN